ncbi:MAG: phosphoglucosamine mutase, partial [Waddliaceae bacterium]|nr:phosphoglucosamine mutase [Waddliaceae bacterium]
LGRAAGKIFRRHDGIHRVVVGKDTRLSCYMFENALIAGLCSMGVNTLMVGPLPTPGVAFITRAYRADAGIMISASHNPYRDNGIKFFSHDGFKLPNSVEKEITDLVMTNDFSGDCPSTDKIGKNFKVDDADGRYIEYIKATLPRKMLFNGLKIVVDCANGASYKVAPTILRELDANVVVYGDKPNGLNINDGYGSLHPDIIQEGVIAGSCDVGIAFDGDADRVIMSDEKGNVVDGDAILAICASDMMKRGKLSNNTVVGTVMSNYGFIKCMEELGIKVVIAPVGDRYVIKEMKKHGANLGGEQSGHIIFMDYNTTGDGIASALQVLRIMVETGKKLSELASIYTPYPQVLINVAVTKKPPIEEMPDIGDAIASAEKELKDTGRVLVRYSGTEKICRVMVEGEDETMITRIAEELKGVITKLIGK